jgi:signal peptidase I
MRNWYWKPMLGAGLLLTGLYALNPLNTATLDPRARLLGLTTYSIPSRSMAPTLEVGDYIAVSTAAYGFSEPKRGDVVVFNAPNSQGINYVKRITALPGDRVAINHSQLLINGLPVTEPYLNPDQSHATAQTTEMPERVIADGELFVLGDNRNNSNDSRFFGTVPRASLIGRVMGIWYSGEMGRIGVID